VNTCQVHERIVLVNLIVLVTGMM